MSPEEFRGLRFEICILISQHLCLCKPLCQNCPHGEIRHTQFPSFCYSLLFLLKSWNQAFLKRTFFISIFLFTNFKQTRFRETVFNLSVCTSLFWQFLWKQRSSLYECKQFQIPHFKLEIKTWNLSSNANKGNEIVKPKTIYSTFLFAQYWFLQKVTNLSNSDLFILPTNQLIILPDNRWLLYQSKKLNLRRERN